MTPRQRAIAEALGRCTFLPGSAHKRFAHNMAFHAEHMPDKPLTEKQAAHLVRLAWRYRRQMPADLAYPKNEEELEDAQ